MLVMCSGSSSDWSIVLFVPLVNFGLSDYFHFGFMMLKILKNTPIEYRKTKTKEIKTQWTNQRSKQTPHIFIRVDV